MEPGNPAVLGATPVDGGVNFALFSSVAERVELCLYDADGRQQLRADLADKSEDVWHGFVPHIGPGQHYGYRIHGRYQPQDGFYCNADKLLIDPYARLLSGELDWHKSVFGYRPGDSADHVPKSVVVNEQQPLKHPVKVPWSKTLFYELNVRGYTMRHPSVPEAERGTFSGMQNGEVLDYLKSLGITSVELMPVQAFVDEHHLARRGLRNYWGYNAINFFAPMGRYAKQDPIAEFRNMVDSIHDAGLEVIMDVVFNHTGEGSRHGPTLSFRGIDNLCYYRTEEGNPGTYINDTGCGNTIDADQPVVQQLVLDSLRYWVQTMGVDGFRFDLATVLGRHAHGFATVHPLLTAIGNDTVLENVKLVAEPWDPGPGGYQLGQFPSQWAEWNDRFRDATRRFWRGDDEHSGNLARRLHGSADLFEAGRRTPSSSINLITAHDGFTLADLVSYEHRHNEANGEDNRDGHAHNYSSNHGVEGPTNDPEILARRRQHRLNLLATLFISQGTPLLLAGDEFGNSQQGNNNAYAQDNNIGWVDWSGADSDAELVDAVRMLIALRRDISLLRLDRYVHGSVAIDGSEISMGWINPDGTLRMEEDWSFGHAFGAYLKADRDDAPVRMVALLFNAWEGDVDFVLPSTSGLTDWRLRFSSSRQLFEVNEGSLTLPAASIAILTAGTY